MAYMTLFVTGVFFVFFSIQSFGGQDLESQVEILKNQIEEIQRSNQEMIERIQKQSNEQINSLKTRIQDLEKQNNLNNSRDTEFTKDKLNIIEKTKKIPSSIGLQYSQDVPSYYRTRARYFKNSTFLGTVSDDEIFFVDSRLSISPQINVSDSLKVKTTFDIGKNIIWGGKGDELISDTLYIAPSPGDSFKGALLRDVTSTFSGQLISTDEDVDLVDIRSLYFVATTDYGEFWVGRQPFDWGMGIVNNAGSMPDQDLGSIVDRFEFDTALLSLLDKKWLKLQTNFIFDRLREGKSIGSFDEGDGWDVGFVLLYIDENLTLGSYIFAIYQNNFALSEGITADLDPGINWSFYASYDYNPYKFSFELQHIFGEINDIGEPVSSFLGDDSIDISAENISLAARVEYSPSSYLIDNVNLEFGYAKGDDATTADELEGNIVFFNNAYVIDNLLFKHMIPTIYASEGSVINSFYLRSWATINLTNYLYFSPQVLFAWVDERNALGVDLFTPLPKVDRYLGTEVEASFTFKIMENMWFDLIGSAVFAGGGLDDLLSQRAFIEGAIDSLSEADPQNIPYSIQGRFVITLDDIVDNWKGSSGLSQRAFFGY